MIVNPTHYDTGVKVIKAYVVGEKLDSDNWNGLVNVVRQTLAIGTAAGVAGTNEEAANYVRLSLKEQEDQYKRDEGVEAVPNAYRSAKSVALQCVALGLPLVDANGNPIGKSACQKAIKEAKDASAPAKPTPTLEDLVEKLFKSADALGIPSEDVKTAVAAHI